MTAYVKNLGGLYNGLYNKGKSSPRPNHSLQTPWLSRVGGHAHPDISAQGLYFAYFWNGTEGVISGTSAFCPLTSGIISLVNDALIVSGKPALGFLNPCIYSKGLKGFTDTVNGSSHGCNTDGFPTAPRWDPVTRFGTPVFPELLELAGGYYH